MNPLPPDFTLLQVTPELDTGGVERTTVDIARAVAAAGGRSLVASRGGRLEKELAAAGGRLIRLPVETKNPLEIIANGGRLARIAREEKVSLIHVRSRAPAFSALIAGRRAGVPVVATYHGVYRGGSPWKRWYNGVMTRGARVIANSDFTRAHLIAEHGVDPSRVATIPRGLDLRRFDPQAVSPERIWAARAGWGLAATEARPVLLLAGRLTPWKGQALLIDALGLLKARGGPDVIAVLAGDAQGRDGYRTELIRQIKAQGVGDNVRIVGHVDDMAAAYLAADFAVAPSVEPEAFGRTAVEPQAMGIPVIAANHGAAVETVMDGETGWLVPPGDAEALAEAIAKAVTTPPSARARMGAAGMVRTRRLYSVEAMTEATLALYAEVLSRSATAPR